MKKIEEKIKELEKEFEKVKEQAVIREKELKVLTKRISDIQAQYAVLDELRKSKK